MRSNNKCYLIMRRPKPKQFPIIPFEQCPAKTFKSHSGDIELGRNVFDHCVIVGNVSNRILDIMPASIKSKLFPEGSSLVVASHDIGKVCPTFFIKINKAVYGTNFEKYQSLSKFDIPESGWGGHAGLSSIALQKEGKAQSIQTIVGQHHGFTPSTETLLADSEIFGGIGWQDERRKLLNALEKEFDSTWIEELSESQVRAISGLTCVADWIGSGSVFDDPNVDWHGLIDNAVSNAGYIPFKVKNGMTFSDIFTFEPREAQIKLIESCEGSGVYVLEAPMGLGKTEAAFYAAYKMLDKGEATGIYFALPTQLTSNKIYDRFTKFLDTILEPDCPNRNALLLHGSAWLEQTTLGKEGDVSSSWFNTSKRGLLAPFAVGTLDQALMSTMNVRHGFVRAFGLAGKVVIIDEVHSYDAYTNVILDRLIQLLRELECTVIILSATLNCERRKEIVHSDPKCNDYPLITAIPNVGDINEISVTPPPETTVKVSRAEQSHAFSEALKRAEEGQQVLWIENTVNDAQQRYKQFASQCSELGIECGLLHSRFTPFDRERNESKWVRAFGKDGRSERLERGRILVGTQVLEQSLDIDSDFLVSRFAPTDMLLQRFGRLWRHNDIRSSKAVCELWVIAPLLENAIESVESVKKRFGKSALVYSEYVLCRSLEAFENLLSVNASVTLPTDIRPLIDATYSERVENDVMLTLKNDLRDDIKRLKQCALSSVSVAGKTRSDVDAQTRYIEEDTTQILLARSINVCDNEKHTVIELISGTVVKVPFSKYSFDVNELKKISCEISKNMVNCSESLSPIKPNSDLCHDIGLGNVLYLGNRKFNEPVPFSIALVEHNGNLKGFKQIISDDYAYNYKPEIGLSILRLNNESI